MLCGHNPANLIPCIPKVCDRPKAYAGRLVYVPPELYSNYVRPVLWPLGNGLLYYFQTAYLTACSSKHPNAFKGLAAK